MRYRYSYHYNSKKQPVVTECEILEGEAILATGIAICSVLDQPCKRQGRKIATQRAEHALKSKRHKLPILRSEPRKVMVGSWCHMALPVVKSMYWR